MPTPPTQNGVSDLLYDLTVGELRDLFVALSHSHESPGRRKDDIVQAVLDAAERDEVRRAAHRTETLSAFKYNYLFSVGPPPLESKGQEGFKKWKAQCWPELSDEVRPLESESGELLPQQQLADRLNGRLYVKFVHTVHSERWERVTPRRKELKEETIRHPVVVVLNSRLGTAEVRFPGFTQGAATPQDLRVSYNAIATQAVQAISERIKEDFQGINLKPAIDDLASDPDSGVIDVRRDAQSAGGTSVSIDSREGVKPSDAAEALMEFLQESEDAPSLSKRGVRAALNANPAQDVVLAWSDYGILTRIRFQELGPEIYFIWKGGSKSLEAVEHVVDTLVERYQFSGPSELGKVLQFLRELPEGRSVQPTDLIQQFDLTSESAFRVLEEARDENLVTRKFRVRSDRIIVDYENNWKDSPADLPEQVTDEEEERISTADPSNLEIAFVRTGSQQ